ncbi:MAG: tRNA guanosine(34) transglycosylase Tgt [Planctomycetota bacterium]|nr:tRNA guanosine(34) transglycosylase Tgt [Planctomycetota bacterium]
MPDPIRFTILDQSASTQARVGRVETPHGSFQTPAFMPVGSRGSVRGLTPDQIRATGSEIILANAYHLMLRPGDGLVARRGGLHSFMAWDGPMLTDSGGYQAYSMADLNAIDDEGVTFKSFIDGAEVHLGPERSIEVQNNLAADIIMAFDDCPPSVDPKTLNESRRRLSARRGGPFAAGYDHAARLVEAHERTVRWLDRCVAAHRRPDDQALFGIVQGGTDLDLRRASVEAICATDRPGYAIGGVAVGEGPEEIRRVVEFTAPLLPADKPRYLMGVGYERDLLAAIRAGVDMFDCVLPTRNGRNAQAFTARGRLHLRNAKYAEDDAELDPGCDCPACAGGFSRAYLRHLFMAGEMLGPTLLSLHNIRHFQRLLLDIRRAIRDDGWSLLLGSWPVLRGEAIDRPAADTLDDDTP